MLKNLSEVIVGMVLLIITNGGYAMDNGISSVNYKISPSNITDGKISIEMLHGNVNISKGQVAEVEYHFILKGKNYSENDAQTLFAKCKTTFDGGKLKSECPKVSDGSLNGYFDVKIPQNTSLGIFLSSGNVAVDGVVLNTLKVEQTTGNFTIKDSIINGASDMLLNTGNLKLVRPIFAANGKIEQGMGNCEFYYDDASFGSIDFEGILPNIKTSNMCKAEKSRLVCSKNISNLKINVRKGNFSMLPAK